MCHAWRPLARDPLINSPPAPAAHSAKSRAPAAGRCVGARRVSSERRCAESAERCAMSQARWGRAESDEPVAPGLRDGKRRAAGVERKATSQAPRGKRRAKNRRVPSGRSRIRNLLRDADRKPGEGFAVPVGVRACRNYRDGFAQSAWWRRGVTSSPKKNPRARLPRAHAVGPVGGSGRGTHDRVVLVSWFRWLFASHGNSFRNSSRTNTPRGKTTSETS